ncbi:CbiQ family ECF transporter T component, partial [Streptococcus suis]
MDKLILGRYIPGNTQIHRLDPRSKLIAMFLFILIVFWANNLVTNVILVIFTLLSILLSQVKLSFFLRGLRPMV